MQKKWVLNIRGEDVNVELNVKHFGGSWEVRVDGQSILQANVKESLQGKSLPYVFDIKGKQFLIYPQYNFKAKTYEITEYVSPKLVQHFRVNRSQENLVVFKITFVLKLILIAVFFSSYLTKGGFATLIPLIVLFGFMVFQTFTTFRTVIFSQDNVFIKSIFGTKKKKLADLDWFLCETNQANFPLMIKLKFKGLLFLMFDYTQIYKAKDSYSFFEGFIKKLENEHRSKNASKIKSGTESRDAIITRATVTLLVLSFLSYFVIQIYYKSSEFNRWKKDLVEVSYKKNGEPKEDMVSYSYIFKGETYQKIVSENRQSDRTVASTDPLYIDPKIPYLSFFPYEVDHRQSLVSASIGATVALFIILGSLLACMWYLANLMKKEKTLKE